MLQRACMVAFALGLVAGLVNAVPLPEAGWDFEGDFANVMGDATYDGVPAGGVPGPVFDAARGSDVFSAGGSQALVCGTMDGQGVLNIGDPFSSDVLTVTFWMKPATDAAWQGMLGKGNGAYRFFRHGADSILVMPQLGADGGHWVQVNGVPMNQWSHIAATYDGSTLKVYLNGANVQSYSFKSSTWALSHTQAAGDDWLWTWGKPFSIGTSSVVESGPQYVGCLDDVAVWNAALTEMEICDVMNNGIPIPEPTTMLMLGLGGATLLRRKRS